MRMRFFILVLALSAIIVPTTTFWSRRRRRTPPCEVNNWSGWTCSQACQKLHTRTVSRSGPGCPPLEGKESISLSVWGNWGYCSNTCGKGTRTRQRTVTDPPNCGGAPYSCDKPLSETQSCYDFRNTDCKVSTWTPFGPCVPDNGKCGSGKATRHRVLLQKPICQGTRCPPLNESISCNATACPVPCTLTEWTEWSGCSQSCGYGHHSRNRSIIATGKHGGSCDKLEEKELCILGRRTDCQVCKTDVAEFPANIARLCRLTNGPLGASAAETALTLGIRSEDDLSLHTHHAEVAFVLRNYTM